MLVLNQKNEKIKKFSRETLWICVWRSLHRFGLGSLCPLCLDGNFSGDHSLSRLSISLQYLARCGWWTVVVPRVLDLGGCSGFLRLPPENRISCLALDFLRNRRPVGVQYVSCFHLHCLLLCLARSGVRTRCFASRPHCIYAAYASRMSRVASCCVHSG